MSVSKTSNTGKPKCESHSLKQSARFSFSFKHYLQKLAQWLGQVMVISDEPKIYQKVNRQGQTIYWQVLDPKSGQTIFFGSELEVRFWLERRFY